MDFLNNAFLGMMVSQGMTMSRGMRRQFYHDQVDRLFSATNDSETKIDDKIRDEVIDDLEDTVQYARTLQTGG